MASSPFLNQNCEQIHNAYLGSGSQRPTIHFVLKDSKSWTVRTQFDGTPSTEFTRPCQQQQQPNSSDALALIIRRRVNRTNCQLPGICNHPYSTGTQVLEATNAKAKLYSIVSTFRNCCDNCQSFLRWSAHLLRGFRNLTISSPNACPVSAISNLPRATFNKTRAPHSAVYMWQHSFHRRGNCVSNTENKSAHFTDSVVKCQTATRFIQIQFYSWMGNVCDMARHRSECRKSEHHWQTLVSKVKRRQS
jgi:hypothetical protein